MTRNAVFCKFGKLLPSDWCKKAELRETHTYGGKGRAWHAGKPCPVSLKHVF